MSSDTNCTEGEAHSAEVEEIRPKAFKLCKEYLMGSWRTIQKDQLIITKVSGGLSNLLYLCQLPPELAKDTQPSQVLLRLYGQINSENAQQTIITESVVFTLLSESQRGPRLWGVFKGGRLEEYIPARALKTEELSDPVLSRLIAEQIAKIHQMKVPISKEPKWLWDSMERWIKSISQFTTKSENIKMFPDRVKIMKTYDFIEEVKWLKKILVKQNSPVVFCHNDLQEGNILIKESCDNKKNIIIIDYEYCSYNYRGFDFANHMCEWLYDYSNEEHPYFWSRPDKYPDRHQQEWFIKCYLNAINGDQESNRSPETLQTNINKILDEIKIFTLASHLFWALWSIVNASVSTIPFDYWEYGITRLNAYFKHKQLISHSGL